MIVLDAYAVLAFLKGEPAAPNGGTNPRGVVGTIPVSHPDPSVSTRSTRPLHHDRAVAAGWSVAAVTVLVPGSS